MAGDPVKIELNPDQALVLFEFLSRYSDTDQLIIEDPSEQRVLWNICCDLERFLVEPFESNYNELLQAARARTKDIAE